MNIRYPIYEGVYRILTYEQFKENHLEANSARHYPSCHSSAHRLGRNQLHHSLLKSPLAHRMTLFNF